MAQRNGTKGARAVTTAGSRNDAFAAQFSVGATAAVRVVRGATADSPSPKREPVPNKHTAQMMAGADRKVATPGSV